MRVYIKKTNKPDDRKPFNKSSEGQVSTQVFQCYYVLCKKAKYSKFKYEYQNTRDCFIFKKKFGGNLGKIKSAMKQTRNLENRYLRYPKTINKKISLSSNIPRSIYLPMIYTRRRMW